MQYRDNTLIQMTEQALTPLLTRFKQYGPTLAPLTLTLAEQGPKHNPFAAGQLTH